MIGKHISGTRKWGYVKIDMQDNSISQIIPYTFSECGRFRGKLAYFKRKEATFYLEGLINKHGDAVWQTKKKIGVIKNDGAYIVSKTSISQDTQNGNTIETILFFILLSFVIIGICIYI